MEMRKERMMIADQEAQGTRALDAQMSPTAARVPVPATGPVTTTADLAASLEAWTAQREVIADFIRHHFHEGIDYYTLQLGGKDTKPSLSKVGAEKFLGLFQLQATFHKDEDTWEMLGRPVGVLCYRCVLTTKGGEIVGEGRGCRDVKKDGGDANKAIKMSEKSALIDAVLRTGALSDGYTQDVEDMAQDAERQTQKRAIVTALRRLGFAGGDGPAYATEVQKRTGLTLVPEHYALILQRLQEAA
jgi:hypothetical protein